MDPKEIGDAVRALRLARGLNVREAGALPDMPVGFAMLNAIENGGNTGLKTLDAVVTALGGRLEVRVVPAEAGGDTITQAAPDLFSVTARIVGLLPHLKPEKLNELLSEISDLEEETTRRDP